MKRILNMIVLAILFYGCNGDRSTNTAPDQSEQHHHVNSSMKVKPHDHSDSDLSYLSFVSDRDTSCGMPLTAGVTDTLVYSGQLFGFCSAACKQQFAALARGVWCQQEMNNLTEVIINNYL
ncbi:hypothetical protein [Niabella hibiscisoli]|uniref:hypothetical protein n=1 Tax=Niabella hibiscisoli TaxID=1825928 RepID=UPI001F0DA8EA|nr:hypothetical protein [Niabella hibiscisoli]MCH5718520.1 hypothetical protein [Niabella hibiscisoli]